MKNNNLNHEAIVNNVARCMKLLYDTEENGGLNVAELENIFGYSDTVSIEAHYSPTQIVGHIMAWEANRDLHKEDKDEDFVPIYEIPRGHWRFYHVKNKETGKTAVMFGASDTETDPSLDAKLPKDEKVTPLFGFVINDNDHAVAMVSAIMRQLQFMERQKNNAEETANEESASD